MALPSNRTEFLEYCMRKLGKGAIDINVTSHQAQDRIDEAIEHFQEYHDEGSERAFIAYALTSGDITNKYITFSNLTPKPLGISRYISTKSAKGGTSFFDVEYQYMDSHVHSLSGAQMQYYYFAMQHLEHIENIFDFHTAINFNKHSTKLEIFEDWTTFAADDYLVFDAVVALSESTSTMWTNKWLRDYTTALIKQQWGDNLSKYEGLQTIGGVTFSGQQILTSANEELEKLETQVKDTEAAPLGVFIG